MSWRDFFYGIQDIGEALLIDPFDKVRAFKLENWWGANLVNWVFLLIFTAISIVGIFIGIWLNKFIDGKKLKKAFGWFVLLMGIYIIYKELANQ